MNDSEKDILVTELFGLVSNLRHHLHRWSRLGAVSVPAGEAPSTRAHDRASPAEWSIPAAEPSSERSRRAERPEATESQPPALPHIEPEVVSALAENTLTGSVGLLRIKSLLGKCSRCRLHEQRRHIVFGEGSAEADLMFIGEAPGYDEDIQGIPFVGKSGQLFTRMIQAMGLKREDVYIANILKCRPPGNRDPEPDEAAVCSHFLRAQIRAINPTLIVTLGRIAAHVLLGVDEPLRSLRGRFHRFEGIQVRCTYHPSYLLRNVEAKRPAWEDLQTVMAEMDRLGVPRIRK